MLCVIWSLKLKWDYECSLHISGDQLTVNWSVRLFCYSNRKNAFFVKNRCFFVKKKLLGAMHVLSSRLFFFVITLSKLTAKMSFYRKMLFFYRKTNSCILSMFSIFWIYCKNVRILWKKNTLFVKCVIIFFIFLGKKVFFFCKNLNCSILCKFVAYFLCVKKIIYFVKA